MPVFHNYRPPRAFCQPAAEIFVICLQSSGDMPFAFPLYSGRSPLSVVRTARISAVRPVFASTYAK